MKNYYRLISAITITLSLLLAANYYQSQTKVKATTAAQQTPQMLKDNETVGIPWTGEFGITERVDQIMARASKFASPHEPEEGKKAELEYREFQRRRTYTHPNLRQHPAASRTAQWPINQTDSQADPIGPMLALQAPQTVGTSFNGAQFSESGFIPPDSMGAVGPTQFLVCINGRIKVFSKTGALGALNLSANAFFSSVLGGSSTGDPRVRFDPLSNRWFVTIITVDQPNKILLAVSSSATITGQSSFTFFRFQHDLVGATPNADSGAFADYETLGIDQNALYIGVNVFGINSFIGTTGYVIKKSSVLGTGPIVVTAFRQLAGNLNIGPHTPQGVDNDDPNATEGYFIGVDNSSLGSLIVRRVSNPGGTPTISGNLQITVPATSFPITVPALGSVTGLDGLDDRLYAAKMHNGNICTAHNIQVDNTGVASDTGNRNGARWYEITNLTTTPTLLQAGTLFDPALTNPRSYWIPSCAISGQGHLALASSYAGTNDRAGIAVTGRLAGDPLGTLRSVTIAQPGASTYNVDTGDPAQRWGDYSLVSVDPTDNMTMWTVQEYCNGTNSYATKVIKLLAPPPAALSSCAPAGVAQNIASTDLVITGNAINGAGFYEPGPTFTNHLTVTINGVKVNSVTCTDATHITVNISTVGATAGSKTITIKNPDGQTATATTIFSVLSGPPTITSFTPTSGVVGSKVTISGTNFTGVNAVQFNGSNAAFTVLSTTSISATVPTAATNGPISVTNAMGTATSVNNFVVTAAPPPTISSFTPTSGPVGTKVTISGTNFIGATAVQFNGLNATFTVISANSISATVPTGATTGKISVTTPIATATSTNSFTVTVVNPNAPVLTSISPTSGTAGTVVTITGSNFTGTTAVKFVGGNASFTVLSSSSIRATVPVGASTGAITVTNAAGTTTSKFIFTVVRF